MTTRQGGLGARARGWARARHSWAVQALLLISGLAQAQTPTDPYSYSRSSSFTYYSNGMLQSEVVEPDRPQLCVSTTYVYDGYGNKSTATTANCAGASGFSVFASRASSSTYGSQIVTINGVSYNVPAGAFATSSSNALGHGETRQFDPRFGAAVSLTGPNGLTTTWALDDFGRKVLETRADGTKTSVYHCLLSGKTYNGVTIDTSSNSPGCHNGSSPVIPSPVSGEDPADAVRYEHSVQRSSSDAAISAFVRTYYDRAGRKLRVVTQAFDGASQPAAAAGLIVQDTDYNAYGTPIVATQPYFLGGGSTTTAAAGQYGMTYTEYDALGRPTAVYTADPNGNAGSGTAFGSRGSPVAAKSTVSYSGHTVVTTDDQGKTRTEEKGLEGQVVRTTDALGAQIVHQHDAFGNLLTTKDPLGNQVLVSYDIRGRKVSLNDPDAGVTAYCYDALGQLKAQQTSNMRGSHTVAACPSITPPGDDSTAVAVSGWTTLAYDKLGRMTQRIEPEYTSNWVYDSCSTGKGKLCNTSTSHGITRKLVYDSLGRPIRARMDVSSGVSAASSMSYDSNGRLSKQTYPSGVRVQYQYTARGFMNAVLLDTKITVAPLPATAGGTPAAGATLNAGTALWQALVVDAGGRSEQSQYANGVNNRSVVNAISGRLSQITAGPGSSNTVVNHDYTWNSLQQLVGRIDRIGDNAGIEVSDSFVYDGIGRLQSYTVSGGNPGSPAMRTVTLQYNALGMVLSKSDVGNYSYPTQGVANGRPHAVQGIAALGVSYGYDLNGNAVSATGGKWRSIAYTSFNLPDGSNGIQGPSNTPKSTWQYDENHQRVRETRVNAGGTRTTWYLHPDNQGGLGFEREIAANGVQSNRHYINAGGQSIAVLVTTGALAAPDTNDAPPDLGTGTAIVAVKLEFWHKDHLGSLIATTDHAGTVTARYAYDPFGKRRYTNSTYDPFGNLIVDWTTDTNWGTDRGFTWHEHLDDVGLVHMNGRLFDPLIGRFLQADPFIQDPANLQNYDRFGYCYNNPLTCTDPSGYFSLRKFLRTLIAPWSTKEGRMIIGIVLSVTLPGAQGILATQFGITNIVANAAVAGFISGAVSTGSVKGALQGAFSAGLFAGAGNVIAGLDVIGGTFSGAAASNMLGAGISSKFAQVALHGVVGCVTNVAGGGKCGPGALSAAFSKAALVNGFVPDNPVGGLIMSAMVGGTASVLGGGKFANGAVTASAGYLFNCLAHECLKQKWDKNADGYHSYTVDSPTLCNTAEFGCLQAARMELLCNSAPGQGQCASVGATVEQNLNGGNKITQYAMTTNIVINGTSPGHIFEDGYVMRSIMIDSNNNVFIRTFGEGVNVPQGPASAGLMGWLNKALGVPLFERIGINNQINTRFRMNEMAGMRLQ